MANRNEIDGVFLTASVERKASWKAKAKASGMTFKDWITHSLDDAPVLKMTITKKT